MKGLKKKRLAIEEFAGMKSRLARQGIGCHQWWCFK